MVVLRSSSKRGSGGGGSMIGPIFLSALLVLAGVLYWNANKMQTVIYNSTDLQEVLQSSTTSHSALTSQSALDCSKPPPETTLAFQQSLGFFDDIDDQEWLELFQKPARDADHYGNPHNPNYGSEKAAFWNFMNQEPVMSCPHLKKVGGLGDGPKWTCDPERLPRVAQRRQAANPSSKESNCLVYSIGSNGNYRFEDGLYNQFGPLCEIHIFDFGKHEASGLAKKNMYYHQWGLGPSESEVYKAPAGAEMYTFQEIKKKLGHEHRAIDIFKIDCEGCEWHTYKDWIKEDIRQILIETHELPLQNQVRQTDDFGKLPMMGATDYFDAFEENGFVMFAKEINSPNWNGIGGRCSEWSYIKMAPEFLDMQNSIKHGQKSAASGRFRRATSGNKHRSSLLKKPLPRA